MHKQLRPISVPREAHSQNSDSSYPETGGFPSTVRGGRLGIGYTSKTIAKPLTKFSKEDGSGEVYNIGGGNQIENEHVVKQILKLLGKPEELIDHVDDRPGHDVRYWLDTSKVRHEFGWTPKRPFEDGLRETVAWYVKNETWWQPLLNERVLSSAPWKSKW